MDTTSRFCEGPLNTINYFKGVTNNSEFQASSYFEIQSQSGTRCLKITEKVSFNIASEACGQTVLPDRPILIRQKLMKSAKIKVKQFG